MIVISSSLVLAAPAEYLPNNPVIGWHNLVTFANVTAGSEADDYPATNLANPITAPDARWRGDAAAADEIVVNVDTVEEIDYVGIARHNFGSAGISVTVEGSTDDEASYQELVAETLLPDDAPALFRFVPQALTHIRLVLGTGTAAPECAVLYAGKLLTLQRRIYVPHTPINYGRSSRSANGVSESGEYLGSIILSESLATAFDHKNMTPDWYRANFDPFIKVCKEAPFFFAWRPQSYPNEIGFCWMTNDPQPQNQLPNGMMQIQLQMKGISS
jgi:hypothetical protein